MHSTPRRLTVPSLIAAGIAAIGASVCCVVPLVLVLAGVSGAWIGTLTALDPWRPWFTAAALLALGAAFWSAYRRPAPCDASPCAPARLRRRRLWLWIATLAIGALLAFPYYAAYLV